MKPKTMYRIALVLGSQAAGLPATLFGIPGDCLEQFARANCAARSGRDAVFRLGPIRSRCQSRSALVQLDTAPAEPPTASTMYQNAYQRNLVMVRALRWLAWLNPSPTTTASFMTVSY